MTRIETRAHAIWALCLASLPSLSRAAESDEAGARVLFVEGRKLADSGNYAEACPKFEDSFRLNPGVGTNFNLADCQGHIGRTASAWTRFLDVAAATKLAGQGERERAARARAAALEPNLARLVVDVSSPVEGLVVERDGIVVGPASWGISIPVDPGVHLVEAAAPGKEKWSQSTTVPDGPHTSSVLVPMLATLPPALPPPTAQIPVTLPAQPPLAPALGADAARRSSIPGVALGALGTVAFATGAVFASRVQSENGEAKALCPTNTCRSLDEKDRHDTLVADAHADRTLAFVSAGIGGAALLAAVYFWRRSARAPLTKSSVNSSAARISIRPTPRALGASFGAHLEVDW